MTMVSSPTTRFPGFDRFFLLRDPLANSPFRGKILAESPFRLLRAEYRPQQPVRVEHAMGGQLRDFIWTTWAAVFVISERLVALFAAAEVTGWTTYAVEVVDSNGSAHLEYRGLAVSGRCGLFDPTKSQMFIKPAPTPAGRAAPYRRGLFFDPATWDGTDVFCSEDGSGFVVVTERVQDLLTRHKATNVKFRRLTEVEARA